MTLQEERAALQKRLDEIDAEVAGFVPRWYVKWDDDEVRWVAKITNNKEYENAKNSWEHVEPFHLVAHKFLPEGWRVVGPGESLLRVKRVESDTPDFDVSSD